LSSRKGERNLDRKARKRGGKASKRGLSDEQVPVLVAADRSGVTVSAVLPAVSAAHLQSSADEHGGARCCSSSRSSIRTLSWSPTDAPVIHPVPPRWASVTMRSTSCIARRFGGDALDDLARFRSRRASQYGGCSI